MGQLDGKKVAFLATDGFERVELTGPRDALKDAGATIHIVSLKAGQIQGMDHDEKSEKVAVDKTLDEVSAGDYDALVLPGGVANPDALRMEDTAVAFVRSFFEAGKVVGAICHAPWLLIEAEQVKGRTVTSWPSVRTDLKNAGATVVDQEVVVDKGLVTSRNPDDVPAFSAKLIEEIAEGRHQAQAEKSKVA